MVRRAGWDRGAAVLALMALGAGGLWAQGLRGTVVGTSEGLVALAVAPPAGGSVAGVAFDGVLRADLERSGRFRLVPFTGAAPSQPSQVRGPLVPPGASFLLSTALRAGDGDLGVEAYLVAAGSGAAVLAREYRVPREGVAVATHRLADDLVAELTGEPGFALSTIVYVAEHEGRPALFSTRPDGSEDARVVSGPFPCLFPRFARDRDWVVYTAYPRGFPELFVRDLGSGRNHAVSSRAGLNTLAALSPDGSLIAATLSFEGNPELYVLSLTGVVRHRLTRARGCDLSPTWSPDGTRVAFVSDRSGAPQIWVVDVQGKEEPRQLTYPFNAARYCTAPSWSPRGDVVAFSAQTDGAFDLFTVHVGTGEVQRLTTGGGDEEDPDWAPDGRHLVAATSSGDRSGLVIIDTRDPARRVAVALPSARRRVRSPTWSPAGR